MTLAAKNCCFFLPLKIGTLIIGLIEILGGLGYIVGGSVIVGDELTSLIAGFTAVGSMMIVSGILMLVSAVVLIVGALRDRDSLLVPWMVYIMTFIIANSFLNIIAASQYIQIWCQSAGDTNAIVAVLAFVLQLYFLFVVNGLYTELKGTAAPSPTITSSRPWTTPA